MLALLCVIVGWGALVLGSLYWSLAGNRSKWWLLLPATLLFVPLSFILRGYR
jgi:hypothetical protein